MKRQVYPSSLFPLRGDVSAEAGATSVLVTGIQGTPINAGYSLNAYDTILYNEDAGVFVFGSPWQIPVGQVLEFEGYGYNPVGISWLASDTIAIGDGTQGDVSGAAAMTALILFGSPDYSDYDLFHTTIYSGATQNWSLILPENPGSSGQVLTTNGQGFTYWSTVMGGGGTPGGSPGDIQYNNSGAFGGSAATINAAGTITVPTSQVLKFSGSGNAGLSWIASDTLAVGNGTDGDVTGGLALTALILYGASAYSAYDAFYTTVYSGATENWSLILPETPGSSGQVLATNGKGFTYWETPSSGFSNPMTTNGDIIFQGAGVPARLAIGSTGQVLTVAGGLPTWATASGGSSSFQANAIKQRIATIFAIGGTDDTDDTQAFAATGMPDQIMGSVSIGGQTPTATLPLCNKWTNSTTTSLAGVYCNSTWFTYFGNGNLQYVCCCGVSVNSNVRMWTGMGTYNQLSAANYGGTDTPSASSRTFIGFRYSTAASDTNWMCVVSNGSAETITSSGVPVDTKTHYFAFICNDAGSSVAFYIDGTLVTTINADYPSNGSDMSYIAGACPITTGSVVFYLTGIQMCTNI